MLRGECADRFANGGEAVAAGWGEIPGDTKRVEGVDLRAGNRMRGKPTEELANEADEPTHHRRFGIATKVAAAIPELRDEPNHGHAAGHSVRVGPLGGRKRRRVFCPVYEEREPLLRAVDYGEVLYNLLQFTGQGHPRTVGGV